MPIGIAYRKKLSMLLMLGVGMLTAGFLQGEPLACDMSGYRATAGLDALLEEDLLAVTWRGDGDSQLCLRFAVEGGRPLIRHMAVRNSGSSWKTLGHNLSPEFGVTTGVRRSGHGLPEDLRWWVYWDAPLSIPGPEHGNTNLPRKPEEVRRFKATYKTSSCEVKTDGARLEISFPGLSMGVFSGELRFTVYRGTNLVRQEVIAKTDEPSLAYIYNGGLKGFGRDQFDRVVWRDVGGSKQQFEFGASANDNPVALRARNRIAVIEGKGGSIAFFPPPHKFFFARQLEVNLGTVWYRKDDDKSFSVGIRHGENHEGYNPTWQERVFALYNAPPGTVQHMPVYFYLSPKNAVSARGSAMAFTHGDRYKPLPGYKTMATHFHVGFTEELSESGSLDTQPPWIPALRALGINMVVLSDFHGSGHPDDPGPLRFAELKTYFEASRRHSDRDFLILPGEEANAHLGGHYNILFPKPVFWTHVRSEGTPTMKEHPEFGNVYHAGNAAEMFEIMKREKALVWQTHPRTKGSTFYPDKIRYTDYFESDYWLGAGFKSLPVDQSEQRLCEVRCFSTLDDMNNWGRPKYLLGEVDTYKKFPWYDLYPLFNINYVKVDPLPPFSDWSPVSDALRAGDFFVSTGEVLIPSFSVEGSGAGASVLAEVEWTFPLEFVEVVWGNGDRTERKLISATDQPPFGSHRYRIPFDATGEKWVRFAVWDSAGNGAFTQPVHLK